MHLLDYFQLKFNTLHIWYYSEYVGLSRNKLQCVCLMVMKEHVPECNSAAH